MKSDESRKDVYQILNQALMEMVYFRLLYLKQTIYELKGDAELPIHNVNLKNIQVGEVKKYIRSSINVSEVTEDNISIEKNINQK